MIEDNKRGVWLTLDFITSLFIRVILTYILIVPCIFFLGIFSNSFDSFMSHAFFDNNIAFIEKIITFLIYSLVPFFSAFFIFNRQRSWLLLFSVAWVISFLPLYFNLNWEGWSVELHLMTILMFLSIMLNVFYLFYPLEKVKHLIKILPITFFIWLYIFIIDWPLFIFVSNFFEWGGEGIGFDQFSFKDYLQALPLIFHPIILFLVCRYFFSSYKLGKNLIVKRLNLGD
jgi:hypothetical protein